MAGRVSRPPLGHHQRRRSAARCSARRARADDLAGSCQDRRRCHRHPTMAAYQGAPSNLRGAAERGSQASGDRDALHQHGPCGRLDRDRTAGHHRRGHSLGQPRRRFHCPSQGSYTDMTDDTLTIGGRDAAAAAPRGDDLEAHIAAGADALIDLQKPDGHWVFELEADCTIPAEYVLMVHYRGEPADPELERKIAAYLMRIQGAHGGWPLFHDGDLDMSASVKAYFALKMIGHSPDAPHMRRAREAILARGGAANSNVFTRALLALYGLVPWAAVPVMPVEIMLLPRWFPFHLSKISYWGRTVIVPLLVLQALKPRAKNPRGVKVDELFVDPPGELGPPRKAPHQKWRWFLLFRAIDAVLRATEPMFPKQLRQRAIAQAVAFVTERLNGEHGLGAIFPAMVNALLMYDLLGYAADHPNAGVRASEPVVLKQLRQRPISQAVAFVTERLNGEHGLGAIFPAMVNALLMYDLLGYAADHPNVVIARRALDKLLVVKDHEAYCQPCVSPVWDTALVAHTLLDR